MQALAPLGDLAQATAEREEGFCGDGALMLALSVCGRTAVSHRLLGNAFGWSGQRRHDRYQCDGMTYVHGKHRYAEQLSTRCAWRR
jgi:hypothetical protein